MFSRYRTDLDWRWYLRISDVTKVFPSHTILSTKLDCLISSLLKANVGSDILDCLPTWLCERDWERSRRLSRSSSYPWAELGGLTTSRLTSPLSVLKSSWARVLLRTRSPLICAWENYKRYRDIKNILYFCWLASTPIEKVSIFPFSLLISTQKGTY